MDSHADIYRVIESFSTAEIKIKGSKFIAEAIPVDTVAAADAALAAIKKRDYDATHHCSAYRIGPAGDLFRFNDDGEPNSSAGLPILRQIEGRELTNTLVVVVRYYGGTKLGTGGLVRAYGDAAAAALDKTVVREIIPTTKVKLVFAYDDTSGAMHAIHQFNAHIEDTAYSDSTTLTILVRSTEIDAFKSIFTEILSGRGECLVVDEIVD